MLAVVERTPCSAWFLSIVGRRSSEKCYLQIDFQLFNNRCRRLYSFWVSGLNCRESVSPVCFVYRISKFWEAVSFRTFFFENTYMIASLFSIYLQMLTWEQLLQHFLLNTHMIGVFAFPSFRKVSKFRNKFF